MELLVWFALWKSDKAEKTRNFNCDVCVARKFYSQGKGRVCFRYDQFPDGHGGHKSGTRIKVPYINEEGKPVMDKKNRPRFQYEWADSDVFLSILQDLSLSLPEYSPWELRNAFFNEVCPSAFADTKSATLIAVESAVSEYKYDISDPEIRRSLLGFDMSLQNLAEAFEVIRGAKLGYQRKEMEEMERKGAQGGGK